MTTPGCCHRLVAQDTSWCAGHAPRLGPTPPKRATASRTPPARCRSPEPVWPPQFPEAQWAVTLGQSAVLYDGEVCLGGGVIATAPGLVLELRPLALV